MFGLYTRGEGTALYRPLRSVLHSRGGGRFHTVLCSVLYSRREGTGLPSAVLGFIFKREGYDSTVPCVRFYIGISVAFILDNDPFVR